MLKITDLQKTFNPGTINAKTALDGLDLLLQDGEFVTVIGGNGAGKSTLLNAIAGVWTPDFGAIEIDGQDVTNMPEHKRAKFLGRVFQDPMMGTAPDMEIAENLAIAARRGTKRKLKWGCRKAERETYKKMLRATGTSTVEDAALVCGIDLTDVNFWRAGLASIAEQIDEFCELVEY